MHGRGTPDHQSRPGLILAIGGTIRNRSIALRPSIGGVAHMIGRELPNSIARSRNGREKPAPEKIVLHVRATRLSPVCEVDAGDDSCAGRDCLAASRPRRADAMKNGPWDAQAFRGPRWRARLRAGVVSRVDPINGV